MNLLTIQTGIQEVQGSTQQIGEASGSNVSVYIFWGTIVVLTFLFFFFLKRTDRIVEERKRLELEQKNINLIVQHEDPSEEIVAAIALAISTYKLQLAELENLTITIQKVSKQYSPWSSKIYSLRQLPK
jgi:hypothetical protein